MIFCEISIALIATARYTSGIVTCPAGEVGVMTTNGGLIWASANLNGVGTFCTNYYDAGYYFTWAQALTACPEDWRLPTIQECADLINANSVANDTPGVADGTYTTVNWTEGAGAGTGLRVETKAVNGATAGQVLWFANGGYSISITGSTAPFANQGTYGYYQTSTAYDTNNTNTLRFNSPRSAGYLSSLPKTYGFNVRCVRDCYRGYVK